MKQVVKRAWMLLAVMSFFVSSPAVSAEVEELMNVPEWVKRMEIKGDMRARFEDVEVDSETSQSRFRVRARIGVYGDVNDDMPFGIRLASGSDESPTSSNQSLDDYSNKRNTWMDLAYFGWNPAQMENLSMVIGKIKKPWEGVSDLVWDGDLNPEGVNAKYSASVLNAQVGYFIMKDNVNGDDPTTDAGLIAVQIDSGFELMENVKLTAGVAGFLYENLQGAEVAKSDAGKYYGKGNTVNKITNEDGSVEEYWVNDYQEIDGFVSLDIKRGPLPVKVYGEYVVNVAADTSDDGWKLGVKTAFLKEKLGVEYNYRDLGRDAVVGALTDSDFGGGGTGSKGHKVSVKYKAMKNCTLGLTALLADNQVKNKDVDTVQADISVKF